MSARRSSKETRKRNGQGVILVREKTPEHGVVSRGRSPTQSKLSPRHEGYDNGLLYYRIV